MVSVEHARSRHIEAVHVTWSQCNRSYWIVSVCEPRARGSSTGRPGVFGHDGLAWVPWMRDRPRRFVEVFSRRAADLSGDHPGNA